MNDQSTQQVTGLVLIGGGGHAKSVVSALRSRGEEVVGVLDPQLVPGTEAFGGLVLGDDRVLERLSVAEVELVNGIGALPGQVRRFQVANQCRTMGFHFKTVVHKAAWVDDEVSLAEGVQVLARAVIQPGAAIGVDTVINTAAVVDHDCVVGRRCHLAPGVLLCGGVNLGDDVHIGTGARLIQGVTVGSGAVIGAGATVVRDVEAGARLVPQSAWREEGVS